MRQLVWGELGKPCVYFESDTMLGDGMFAAHGWGLPQCEVYHFHISRKWWQFWRLTPERAFVLAVDMAKKYRLSLPTDFSPEILRKIKDIPV